MAALRGYSWRQNCRASSCRPDLPSSYKARMSPPAENARSPAAVIITRVTAGSSAQRSSCARSATTMGWVTALSAFGRLSVTTPAAPRRSNRISSSLTPASTQRPKIGGDRDYPERAATPVQPSPLHDQPPSLLGGLFRRRCLEHAIGRHDDAHRIGPGRKDQRSTDKPAPVIAEQKCEHAERARHDRQACLHDCPALVTWLPLGQKRPGIEPQS